MRHPRYKHFFFALGVALCLHSIGLSVILEPSELEKISTPGSLYAELRRLNDGSLYFAKAKETGLWLVMERVTRRNLDDWKHYAQVQTNSRAIEVAGALVDTEGNRRQKGTTGDGSLHFKAVLNEVSPDLNEMWVAFVSRDKMPPNGIPNMASYRAENLDTNPKLQHAFATHVVMFMTVTSSPQALITSHMGIATSIEGVLNNRPKGISIDLHAFAAKVMRERNPARKYMINAPVFAMEKLLADALPPGSVFAGTREMQQNLLEKTTVTLESFKQAHPEQIKEIQDDLQQDAQEELSKFTAKLQRIPDQKEPLIQRVLRAPSTLLERDSQGGLKISQAKLETALQKGIEDAFTKFKNPYPFGRKFFEQASQEFLDFWKQHPPLLSGDEDARFTQRLTIFDKDVPERPWLTLDAANRATYDWMFTRPFRPAGNTHYIVIDLERLAQAKALAPST